MIRTFSSAPFPHVVRYLSRRFTGLEVLGKDEKTIFALSTGAGKAGIAIIRISGPGVNAAAMAVCKALPRPRLASSVKIYSPLTSTLIDRGLAIRFPGPASFTGEDVLELHVHGGPAVIRETLNALGSLPGLRPAAAGEFSQRAFENGKLDLTQAEGIMDLINAETEQQRIQALRQTEGELGFILERWRVDLKKSLAYTEAFIDFSEDDQIEPETLEASSKDARQVLAEVTRFLADGRLRIQLTSGEASDSGTGRVLQLLVLPTPESPA
jgi:tRNA modification GTPase